MSKGENEEKDDDSSHSRTVIASMDMILRYLI